MTIIIAVLVIFSIALIYLLNVGQKSTLANLKDFKKYIKAGIVDDDLIRLYDGAVEAKLKGIPIDKNRLKDIEHKFELHQKDKKYIVDKKGYSTVNIATLESFAEFGGILDEQTLDLMINAQVDEQENVSIKTLKLIEFENKRNERIEQKDLDYSIFALKNEARSVEKDFGTEKALPLYKEAVSFGFSNDLPFNRFAHDIERMLIIYRKLKMIDEEYEFLEFLIDKYPDNESYKNQYAKSLIKINKSKNQ